MATEKDINRKFFPLFLCKNLLFSHARISGMREHLSTKILSRFALFTYNYANLVTSIQYKDDTFNYFHYDSKLRRYALEDSDGLAYFVWDSNGLNLLAEKDEEGNTTAQYVHGYTPISGIGSMVAAKKEEEGATYYQYAIYDHRGTVVKMVDENGEITGDYEYNAWGVPLHEEESGAENRYGYQSNWIHLKDSNGQILLSPTRVYLSEIGRFSSRDSLPMVVRGLGFYRNSIFKRHLIISVKRYSTGYDTSFNLYKAFENSSQNYVDLTGLYDLQKDDVVFVTHVTKDFGCPKSAKEEAEKIVNRAREIGAKIVHLQHPGTKSWIDVKKGEEVIISDDGTIDSKSSILEILKKLNKRNAVIIGGGWGQCHARTIASVIKELKIRYIVLPRKAIYDVEKNTETLFSRHTEVPSEERIKVCEEDYQDSGQTITRAELIFLLQSSKVQSDLEQTLAKIKQYLKNLGVQTLPEISIIAPKANGGDKNCTTLELTDVVF